MASAGELLRSERLKQGRTLADIADETCISKRYLEAIEADSAEDLPGEFFYKAFMRQYADALALDPDDTGRILAAAVPLSEPDPVPVLSQVYERAQAGEPERWRPSTGVAVGLLAAVLAGGSLMYAWWQRTQATRDAVAEVAAERHRTEPVAAPAQPAVSPPANAQPADTPRQNPASATTEASTPPSAPVERPVPAPQAGTAEAKAPAQSAPPVQPVPGQPLVEVSATEPAWVQVSSEGKTIFTGILEPNQSQQIPTAATATLRTGNAGAVEVRWNGKSVGPVGPKGQIRVIRFTPEGAEILTPRPKNVLAETELQP